MTPPAHDPAGKQRAIVDAAIHCFQDQGFANTTITAIARAAGVGKGTVYESHRSKESLLLAACMQVCGNNEDQMIPRGAAHDVGELLEQGLHPVRVAHQVLHAVFAVLLDQTPAEQRLFSELINILAQQPALAAEARESMGAKIQGWRAHARGLYDLCHQTGYFRDLPDPDASAQIIVAAVEGMIWHRQWLAEETPDQAATRLADAWMHLNLAEPRRLEEFLS
jgi:AcrR family transcriptional regulator